mgnify:CR=1 FL=1
MLANGARLQVTDYHDDLPSSPVVIRSLAKADILKYRKEHNLPFYYMDTGYTGGHEKVTKEDLKPIHRIVYNDLQLSDIVERPSDRWKKFELRPSQVSYSGATFFTSRLDDNNYFGVFYDDDVFEDYENGWARKSDFVGPDNVTINDCR